MDRLDKRRPYWRDEDDQPDMQEFQERHQSFSDRVERVLMQLVILGLVALTLVQTLQVIPFIRRQISLTDALEGIPYKEVLSWASYGSSGKPAAQQEPVSAPVIAPVQTATVTVAMISHRSMPGAKLLVDGKAVAAFQTGSVTVKVKPGQVLAVDGRTSPEQLTFRVVGAPGLASPEPGTSVTTRSSLQVIGSVRPAN